MAEEMSQEQLLAEQKANCIFCKIVGGEVPSKEVFEDERMLAILDIRPAVKGHCLVMPREHYPIMPLIPPEEFAHLFGKTAALSRAVREGMLAQRTTTFIANGAIAGQQSPHFLFHLIPREEGDGLGSLAIPAGSVDQSEVAPVMQQNLGAVMRQHLQQTGQLELLEAPSPAAATPPSAQPSDTGPAPPLRTPEAKLQPTPEAARMTAEQLAEVIEQNPEVKALLMNNPEKLQGILDANPQLKPLFAGVDVQKLGEELRRRYLARKEGEPTPGGQLEPNPSPPEDPAPDIRPASQLTLAEIFAFIESKPKLRALILEEPERLAAMIPGNPRLAKFFRGSDARAIIEAYRAHAQEEAP